MHSQAGSPVDAIPDGGGGWTVWGRGAWTRFGGAAGGLDLDGDVLTGTVAVDWEQGAVLAGLGLPYSAGDGTFSAAGGRSGTLTSRVATIHPYVRLALHERLAVWGLFGYGLGARYHLDPSLSLTIEGARSEHRAADPKHVLRLSSAITW